MPVQLLALVPALVAWGGRALATYGLARLFSDEPMQELERMLKSWVVEQAAHYAGLSLDHDAPWSDASLAGAVGQKIGVPLRSLRNRDYIVEDLDSWVVGKISEKSGYQIRSILNQDTLRQDIERIALAVLTSKIGIPAGAVGDELNPEAIKANIIAWAKAELMANMGEEIGFAVQEIIASGGLEAIAQDLNSSLKDIGSKEAITSRQLAVRVASKLASQAVAGYGKVAAGMADKNRKREANRQAQARFRARWGYRHQYIPVGMPAPG